jgi:hypothetical protein
VGDDAVHAVGRLEVLAQQPDPDLRDRQRVGGVDAELGEAGRMRLTSAVADGQVLDREARQDERLVGGGVDHHRGVDAVEHAGVEHQDLAAAALLGRRPDDLHGEAELVGERREREPGPDRGRGDDVVAARVADPGSASYSAQIAMVSGPLPAVATNAVSRPPTAVSTCSPAAPSSSTSRALERCSSNASSASPWTACDSPISRSASRVIVVAPRPGVVPCASCIAPPRVPALGRCSVLPWSIAGGHLRAGGSLGTASVASGTNLDEHRGSDVAGYRIAVIGGDGIGPEVVGEALKVLDAVEALEGFTTERTDFDLGGRRYLATGEVLSDATLEELRAFDAILLGAVGTPDVPPGVLERGLLLKLRFAFDQYVNLRPVKLYPGVPARSRG